MLHVLFGNDRPAPDVLSQPFVELEHWRILQGGSGSLHIAARLASGSFRLTSMLIAIDLQRAQVRTESGRCYHLCMPPEEDEPVRHLIVASAARDLAVSGDVSGVIWRAVSSGSWSVEGILLPPFQ